MAEKSYYKQLEDYYQGKFPGYDLTEGWLKQAKASGLDVSNPAAVGSFISTDPNKVLNEVQRLYPDLNPEIAHAQGMKAKEVDIYDGTKVREFMENHTIIDDPATVVMKGQKPLYEINVATKPVVHLDPFDAIGLGFKSGFNYGAGNDGVAKVGFGDVTGINHHPGYGKSVIAERAPEAFYKNMSTPGKVGFAAGRVAADVSGYGTRKFLWNIHPLDIVWTGGSAIGLKSGHNKGLARGVGFVASEAVGLGSGNYDITNLAEGGRPKGFTAVSADEIDPRKSTNPVVDLLVQRALFGRTGKLLPWKEFNQERPEIRQEDYEDYKDWLTGREKDPIGQATLGLVKFNNSPVMGADLRVLGYHVSPLGAALGAATIGALTAPGVVRYFNPSKLAK